MGYLYIFLTILFTVYGQMIIKWQVSKYGSMPGEFGENLIFLLRLFLNFWIISAFISAFIASLCWMAAMTKFQLSFAYPFMSLAFIIVLLISVMFLGEPLTWTKVVGTFTVVLGLIIITR